MCRLVLESEQEELDKELGFIQELQGFLQGTNQPEEAMEDEVSVLAVWCLGEASGLVA